MRGYSAIRGDLVAFLNRKTPTVVQLVVGLDYLITDPEPLEDLLKVKGEHQNLSVNYWYTGGQERYTTHTGKFHPKLFIFTDPSAYKTVILGSSNLTAGGIRENVEANVLFRGKHTEFIKAINDAEAFFERIFKQTKPLDEDVVKKYRVHKRKASKTGRRLRNLPMIPESGQTPTIPISQKPGRVAPVGPASAKELALSEAFQRPYWKIDKSVYRSDKDTLIARSSKLHKKPGLYWFGVRDTDFDLAEKHDVEEFAFIFMEKDRGRGVVKIASSEIKKQLKRNRLLVSDKRKIPHYHIKLGRRNGSLFWRLSAGAEIDVTSKYYRTE